MEHRYSQRIAVSLPVEVFRRQRSLGRFTTRDIGLEGLFLESGPVRLHRNDMIELKLWDGSENHQLRGLVIHASEQGVGVMLDEANHGIFHAILMSQETAA